MVGFGVALLLAPLGGLLNTEAGARTWIIGGAALVLAMSWLLYRQLRTLSHGVMV